MEIRQGFSYHIKSEFFDMINDKYLMSNKENGNYRPHFYAIKHNNYFWMIPISSQTEKYKKIINQKLKKYGRCNTIIIGKFAGKENAFLVQNAFPIIEKYIDHAHTIENKPIKVHKDLNKTLVVNLKEVLAMKKRGIKLLFADVDKIKDILKKEL